MLHCVIALLCIAAAPPAFAQPSGGIPDPKHALEGEALVRALRNGGHSIFFRHTVRNWEFRERESFAAASVGDCATQSPLSPIGQAQARSIGESMAALKIPIGEAIASPFCRTLDTARLIAGHVTGDDAARGLNPKGVEAPLYTRLAEMLAVPPARGTNRIIVGHVQGFESLGGSPYLQEGEAAVFRMIDSRRVLVARLRAEDWKALAAPANRPSAAERSSAADPQLVLHGNALLNAVRAGGYTVYFRHTATDVSQRDLPKFAAADCKAQRNLSESGRAQARKIGEAVIKLRLQLGDVIASPYCRTMESARLIAGRAAPEEAVRGRASAAGGAPDYSGLEKILATPVNDATLRIIVGHGNEFRAVAGAPHLEEGEAALLRTVPGGWIVVARLRPEDWPALVEVLERR